MVTMFSADSEVTYIHQGSLILWFSFAKKTPCNSHFPTATQLFNQVASHSPDPLLSHQESMQRPNRSNGSGEKTPFASSDPHDHELVTNKSIHNWGIPAENGWTWWQTGQTQLILCDPCTVLIHGPFLGTQTRVVSGQTSRPLKNAVFGSFPVRTIPFIQAHRGSGRWVANGPASLFDQVGVDTAHSAQA